MLRHCRPALRWGPLLLLLGGPAWGASGLTVRLISDTPLTDPVVLLDDGGHQTTLPLRDDGQQPDVIEGDGTFAATTIASGGEMKVTVQAGGKSWSTTSAAFPEGAGPRDLDLSVSGDTLVAAGKVAGGGSGPNAAGPKAAGPRPSGGVGGQGLAPPVGVGASDTTYTQDNTALIVALGVGVVALIGLALWGRRGAPAPAAAQGSLDPKGCALLPEGGWLGPHSPPFSEGIGVLVVDPADEDAALPAVLRALARRHRVILLQAAEAAPPVVAGEVYLSAEREPARVGDLAELLLADGGLPVAVVVRGAAAARAQAYSDQLPESVGGLLLCAEAGGVEGAMRLQLGAPSTCTFRGQEVALHIAPDGGFVVSPPAAESP
ncbi:MAG: hypothetical protein JNM72_28485 [Deltaproteobacteria bacterium]|nr:hypothetical protein [Deltaproteobacteria bacterium]